MKAVDPVKPQPEADLKLAHEISFRWLILFALPTICSSIFSNLYTAVDGAFVARWIHTDALSAINITMPMTYLASALGMMFGIGGNDLTYGTVRRAQTDFISRSSIYPFLRFGSPRADGFHRHIRHFRLGAPIQNGLPV